LRNARVAPQVIDTICAKAVAAGLLVPAQLGHSRCNNKAARLLGVHEFDDLHGLRDPAEEALDEIVGEIMREAA
jgi:hypothetical protein